MKKIPMFLTMAACLAAAGCQRPLHADSMVLNGEVPRCRELLLPEKQEYRDIAKKECDAATTPEQRKRSGGCAIVDYMRFCSNAVIAGHGLVDPPVERIEE